MSNMKQLLEDQIEEIAKTTFIPVEVVRAYFDDVGIYTDCIEDLAAEIADATYGYWETPRDFAIDTLDSFVVTGNEWWTSYIDYDRMGYDLLHTDFFTVPHCGGIWVFRNL